MKRFYPLLLALVMALMFVLIAGCDDNATTPVAKEKANLNITVYDAGMATNQEITRDFNGTGWSANPGRLWFTLNVSGTKSLIPEVDFQIWKSVEPQNWNDPAKDLASFKTLVANLPKGTEPTYNFTDLGRYLIRAYRSGTKTEVSHTRLTINQYQPPTPVAPIEGVYQVEMAQGVAFPSDMDPVVLEPGFEFILSIAAIDKTKGGLDTGPVTYAFTKDGEPFTDVTVTTDGKESTYTIGDKSILPTKYEEYIVTGKFTISGQPYIARRLFTIAYIPN